MSGALWLVTFKQWRMHRLRVALTALGPLVLLVPGVAERYERAPRNRLVKARQQAGAEDGSTASGKPRKSHRKSPCRRRPWCG